MFLKVEECNTISCVWIRSENTICFELHFRFMIDITFSNLVDFRNLRLRCNERAGWCWNIFQNPKQMPEMDSLTNSALRPNFSWLLRSRIGRNPQKTLKISHSRFFFPVQNSGLEKKNINVRFFDKNLEKLGLKAEFAKESISGIYFRFWKVFRVLSQTL